MGRDPREVPVCAVGAIWIAADRDLDYCGRPVQTVEAFAGWLATTGQSDCGGTDPVEVIGLWNDDRSATPQR